MGGFISHAVAGTMFLTISVWWFIGDVLQMNRRSGTLRAKDKQKRKRRSNRFQLVWYQCPGPTLSKIPLEPMIKVVLSAIGILVEMPFNNSAKLYDEQGELITKNLRNHGHALMYGFFGLNVERYRRSHNVVSLSIPSTKMQLFSTITCFLSGRIPVLSPSSRKR